MSNPWSRWKWARFHLRCAQISLGQTWHVIWRCPQKTPAPLASPTTSHPSELCKCVCGPEAQQDEHDITCPWLINMCKTCSGTGHCPECHGDGTAAFATETCTVCGKVGHWSPDCPDLRP